MPYTKLTITVPGSIWIGEISRAYPETGFRVLAATTCSPSGVVQLEIHSAEYDSICGEIRGYNSVTELTVFETNVECCRIQVETTVPLLLMAIEGSGVPLETPFEIRNGRMGLEAMLPQHRLSTLSDQFERFDIDFTVDEIRQDDEADALLTERQRWLVEEAIDRGYYDTPPGQYAHRSRRIGRPRQIDLQRGPPPRRGTGPEALRPRGRGDRGTGRLKTRMSVSRRTLPHGHSRPVDRTPNRNVRTTHRE